jgi:murein DD-endopeptidase MepM/ murein hydrolase activator NlpD
MQTQPLVHEGQTVAAGQPLGLVDSSGHSSGPHLHYETHLGGYRTQNAAVDPIQFMHYVGPPLGEAG